MLIYNSATHAKEEFQPIEAGKVRMYVCGPTVYDNIHIGNARTFISFDVIRRWLIASGYEVTFAQNLTDVDDKIINRANEQGRTAAEVAEEFSKKFIDVMHRANVLDPDVRPRATKEIGPHDRHDQEPHRARARLRGRQRRRVLLGAQRSQLR